MTTLSTPVTERAITGEAPVARCQLGTLPQVIDEQQREASGSPDGSPDQLLELREANLRLRQLVGPVEQSYADLRTELAEASEAVKAAEAANGELRGEVMELTVALGQARHNMGKVSRIVRQRSRRVVGRLSRPIRRRFNDWRS